MPSFIPPYNADNVNVGLASMYIQPYSTVTPADLPDDDTDLGTQWDTPWVALGATDSGLEFQFSRKTNPIMIEEQVIEVDEETESLTFSMNVTLAEDTLATMRLAYGGGTVTTTGPSSTLPGIRTLQLSTDLEAFAFGFEVKNEAGFWRRYLVPKVKSVADVKTTFSRSKDKRMYSVSFSSLVAPEDVIIREKTANHTA